MKVEPVAIFDILGALVVYMGPISALQRAPGLSLLNGKR